MNDFDDVDAETYKDWHLFCNLIVFKHISLNKSDDTGFSISCKFFLAGFFFLSC